MNLELLDLPSDAWDEEDGWELPGQLISAEKCFNFGKEDAKTELLGHNDISDSCLKKSQIWVKVEMQKSKPPESEQDNNLFMSCDCGGDHISH